MNKDLAFEQEVSDLIASGVEGEYWDFKREYYDKDHKCEMLHDIICLANTQSDHDSYLIFGIEDKTCAVYGVENDPHRRRNEDFIAFLRDKPFIAGIRPEVQMKTIQYQGHEIDVLIIKNTRNTPYFLSDNFDKIRPGCIYTRVSAHAVGG